MDETLPINDAEYDQIDQLYDECLSYLKAVNESYTEHYITKEIENYSYNDGKTGPIYETIKTNEENKTIKTSEENKTIKTNDENESGKIINEAIIQHSKFKVENEIGTSATSIPVEVHSERLRRLSEQLPKIIITQSNNSLNVKKEDQREKLVEQYVFKKRKHNNANLKTADSCSLFRQRAGYGDFQKRLVSKSGVENVALISNVPFEKIRLLNDAFHTLINLRWRWIVSGTIVLHFGIWLVFALFWYITALAHYDLEPSPPPKSCVTGGHDFVTIFLASVEAQTTIGFGDRAIDEECPESIFLFIMQLILGTGLSGVLTCVVYAKLTRPEKLSRYGVGFSKKAVISVRDGRLCLMLRAWDLNYDHIIGSEFTAHFINTYRTNEGESLRYFARPLRLQQRQFLLWPVVLVHVIDETSPLFDCSPEILANRNYEITVSLKGASASMGTFTQSQTSYLPREVVWGYRFPSVVRYNSRKQKYVIDYKKLHSIEPVDTPYCSASQLNRCPDKSPPGTPSSFIEKMISFQINRTSSFNKKKC